MFSSRNRVHRASTIENVTFYSQALHRDMEFDIYLPPDYDDEKSYPVLYMLYGHGGAKNSWFDMLGMNKVADRLILQQRIAPLMIVSPDYGNSFGVNSRPGPGIPANVDIGMYEDYLAQDVVAYVDAHFSTIPNKAGRYIGGASMGGYAALYLAFTHPDLYSKVVGSSSYLCLFNVYDQYLDQRDWLYPTEEVRAERDPLILAQTRDLQGLEVHLDCGKRDNLAVASETLHQILRGRNVSVQWNLNRGGHDLSYWAKNVRNYLSFCSSI